MEVLSVKEEELKYGVVFGFNVKVNEDVEEVVNVKGVLIFVGNIIYKFIEDYEVWVKEEEEKRKCEFFKNVIFLGVIRFYLDECYVFRRSKLVIVGVEVFEGRIRLGVILIKEIGEKVGVIKLIKNKNDFV